MFRTLVYLLIYCILTWILFYLTPVLAMVWIVTLPLRWMLYDWIEERWKSENKERSV